MSKYKAIVFDFDNTLFDGTTWFVDFVKEFLKDTPYSNWDYRDFYTELNTTTGTSDKIVKEVSDRYWIEMRKARIGKVIPFSEDSNAITILHQMGIKMGICSRSIKTKIEELLANFNMQDNFEVIVEKAQKPDAIHLLDAISQLRVLPSEVLYVGDEDEDIELGKNAGVDTAYLLRKHEHFQVTSKLQKDRIDRFKPTYRITNLLDLVGIVKS